MKTIPGSPLDALLNLALFIAPALLLTSSVVYAVTEGPGEGAEGGVVMNLGCVFFALVAVKLATLVGDRFPTAAAAALLVMLIGVAGGVGYGVAGYAIEAGGPDINEAPGLPGVAIKAFGLCFPLGLVFFGVLLARSRAVALPIGLGVALGGVLFPAGRISNTEVIMVACDLVLLVSLAAVALTTRAGSAKAEAAERLTSPARA